MLNWGAPRSKYYDDEDCDLDKNETAYELDKCKENAVNEIVDFLEDRSRAQIRKSQARYRLTKRIWSRDETIAEKVIKALISFDESVAEQEEELSRKRAEQEKELFNAMLKEMPQGTQVDFS